MSSRTVSQVFCVSTVFVAVLTLASGATAQAATPKAPKMQVSPTILEIDAKAGETVTRPITVTAVGPTPFGVTFVHADFGFEDSSYHLTLIEDKAPETTAFSTRDWFSIPKPFYRVLGGKTVTVPLRIKIPDNTPGGTYLGAALLQMMAPDNVEGSQVRTVPRTGPLVFVSVDGGDPPKPKIAKFKLPRIIGTGPISPDIVITNQGDEWFAFDGTVKLKRDGKDESVTIRRQFVVPGQPRALRISPDDRGAGGKPKLGTKNMGFGRHKVTLRLRIDPTGTTITTSRTVWVIPTWVRVLALLLVTLAAAGIVLLVRRLRGRRIDAAASEERVPEELQPELEPEIEELDVHEDYVEEYDEEDDADDATVFENEYSDEESLS